MNLGQYIAKVLLEHDEDKVSGVVEDTKYPYTIYKGDVSKLETDGNGISFFTRDKEAADYYTTSRQEQGVSPETNKTFEGNIVAKNPLIVDANKPSPIELKDSNGKVLGIFGQGDYIQAVKDAGYDAIIVNRKFGTPLDGWEIVSFDRKQIVAKQVPIVAETEVERLRAVEQKELLVTIPNIEEYKVSSVVKLTESQTGTIGEFIKFAAKNLDMQNLPGSLTLSYDNKQAQDKRTFGFFDPHDNKIWIYVKNRNMADILRTLAHELVHRKQEEDGKLDLTSGQTGSPIEDEANSMAGVLLRNFGKINSSIYEHKK